MKKCFLLSILVVLAFSLKSQNIQLQAPPGYNYIYPENSSRKGTEGSPYLRDWALANLLFTNGSEMIDIPVKYNVLSNQMLYQDNNQTYLIGAPDSILEIRFLDKTFIYKSYTKDKKTVKSFFERVINGKVCLLNKYEIEVIPSNYNEALSSGNKNDVLTLKQKLYLQNGNNIVPINKKKLLLEAMKEHKNEVVSFIKKERLSYKKKEDVATIIQYYNQLP